VGGESSDGNIGSEPDSKRTYSSIQTEKEINKGKSEIRSVLIHVFLIFIVIMGIFYYNYCLERNQLEKNTELHHHLVSQQNRLETHLQEMNSISARYPSQMASGVYVQYVEEYSSHAEECEHHLREFEDFISENELSLQIAGVDTFQLKNGVRGNLSFIHKNLEEMENRLQAVKEEGS
jgi:hypothetical protein